eukprot:5162018-Prymnesium_polylepis.1
MRTDVRHHPSAALVSYVRVVVESMDLLRSRVGQRPRIVGRRSYCSDFFVESVPADYNAHNY